MIGYSLESTKKNNNQSNKKKAECVFKPTVCSRFLPGATSFNLIYSLGRTQFSQHQMCYLVWIPCQSTDFNTSLYWRSERVSDSPLCFFHSFASSLFLRYPVIVRQPIAELFAVSQCLRGGSFTPWGYVEVWKIQRNPLWGWLRIQCEWMPPRAVCTAPMGTLKQQGHKRFIHA